MIGIFSDLFWLSLLSLESVPPWALAAPAGSGSPGGTAAAGHFFNYPFTLCPATRFLDSYCFFYSYVLVIIYGLLAYKAFKPLKF